MQVAGPGQLATRLGVGLRKGCVVQLQGGVAHTAGLSHVHAKPRLQRRHGDVARVLTSCARALCQQPLVEVDDDALAQRTLGRPHVLDAKVREQRVQDGQAAGDHGAAVVAQARHLQAV